MSLPVVKSRNRKCVSVWMDDNDADGLLKQFRCINCGKVVFEYYSRVHLIVPGSHEIKAPQVIECHGKREFFDEFLGKTYDKCRLKYWIA